MYQEMMYAYHLAIHECVFVFTSNSTASNQPPEDCCCTVCGRTYREVRNVVAKVYYAGINGLEYEPEIWLNEENE